MDRHEKPLAEGWYRDPFGLHDGRWLSGGRPTDLVCDDAQVTHDEPPDEPMPASLERLLEGGPTNGEDLKRIGDAKPREGMDPKEQSQRVWDVIGGTANHS